MKFLKMFSLRMPKYYDRTIHFCVILLLVFGSIMIVSTSVGEVTSESNSVVYTTILKQCVFVVAAYIVMTFVGRNFVKMLSKEVRADVDQKKNRRLKNAARKIFFIIGIAIILMLIYCLLFGEEVNGAKAWINLKYITIQPSEFAKTYLILALSIAVNERGDHYNWNFIQVFGIVFLYFLAVVILIALEPDFGTLLIFCCIACFCMLIPSHPSLKILKRLIVFGLVAVTALLLFFCTEEGLAILEKFDLGYAYGRFTSTVNPFADLYDTGYNMAYSLYAIANGGLWGLGLGNSEQKYGYLPEAGTDFIFSITIEETGIFGLIIICGSYLLILFKLCYYALKTNREGYKIVLIGTAAYLSLHFVLNVGGVSALIPLTGVPLLFISSGGSSLVSIMIMVGACQSVIGLIRGKAARRKNNETVPNIESEEET